MIRLSRAVIIGVAAALLAPMSAVADSLTTAETRSWGFGVVSNGASSPYLPVLITNTGSNPLQLGTPSLGGDASAFVLNPSFVREPGRAGRDLRR